MSKLIIVESPTKAKTISKFLPRTYKVKSSMGHIRDLPKKEMGIDIENLFTPKYVIPKAKQKQITELKKLAKDADEVILATDEDREGEAIAWHLFHALGLKGKPVKRIVFHEITKTAIEKALENPRDIDQNLVNAQQARRILDRLVGYELSPFLWKKIRYGLSAGRVQSVAVRLVCEREAEIEKFVPQEYWSVTALCNQKNADKENAFETKLIKSKGKRLDKFAIANEKSAKKITKDLENADFIIESITKKERKKKTPSPFTTSTLQQEAANKLGFSSKQTMMIAQQLYEGIKIGKEQIGLITYMRTDSQNLADSAVKSIRETIEQSFGKNYVPKTARKFKTKSKGAQEAHEAIRPTFADKTPDSLKAALDSKQFRLYDLIWRRTLASQMEETIVDATTVDITANDYTFRANGSIIKFDGFLKVYKTKTKETILPPLKEKEELDALKVTPNQHFTEPPARFSEATLIKELEEHGIGRPSTYAPTISTVVDRGYVEKNDDKRFFPTDTGKLVNDVLVKHFEKIVDIEFTAKMEEDLDDIAHKENDWVPVISEFYKPFKENLIEKDKTLTKKELTEEETDEVCEKCSSPMIIKMGRFGKFMACSNYPECKNTKPIKGENEEQAPDEPVGKKCPKCKKDLVYKKGRFGKFIGCSGYPDCKHIEPISTGVKCGNCDKGEIVEKKSKRGRAFYGCNQYPDCEFTLWTKPTGEKCPDCKSLLVHGAKNTARCSSKECKFKKELEEKE